jgi:hypothetical protein
VVAAGGTRTLLDLAAPLVLMAVAVVQLDEGSV